MFARMRAGEFPDGAHVLRAKIDMASPNINMRDPVLYRIRRAHHHRTGDAWCIYPMYDFAHPPSDALEQITHSLCTLEFEDHRPLYDWLIDNLPVPAKPQQIEFARLNLTYTIMSKRKLLELVQEAHVAGWDDPRMPTIVGMRRRGYTPTAIRAFCDRIGVAKRENIVDVALLEHAVREDLNDSAPRVMGVLDPLRVVIENYPEGQSETFEVGEQPGGRRPRAIARVPFSRVLWIERDDFREDPPKKFFRLSPGREVRLRGAYFVEVHRRGQGSGDRGDHLTCAAPTIPRRAAATRRTAARSRRRCTGCRRRTPSTWRCASTIGCSPVENPGAAEDYRAELNPGSLEVLPDCKVEPSVAGSPPGTRYPVRACRVLLRRSRLARPSTSSSIGPSRSRTRWAKIEARGGT